ncbi:MAG TPA: helix-turn-helix domain-containing protein [Tepidisphaeraceae bacterium]|nr:helix-turn-helix domain-containing protein [Tepidisphaeraceae bacterium]
MAKMFYNVSEAKAALGKSEEEIKQYVREGRLREFRDGAQLMFKADQVDALKAQLGGGGGGGIEPVDLGPSDSGAAIGLVDSRGGSGTGIGLADTGGIGSGVGSGIGSGVGSGIASSGSGLSGGISGSGLSGLGSAGSGMMNLKEDTALAADLGMSGSVGGVPSPARSAGSGTGLSGSAAGRGGSGINVFGEEPERVDPMAQTAISSSGSIGDLNLEGVGSGSGLLDLTRESDDTSLGAELLDEISPGGKRPVAPPDTGAMTAVGGSGVGLEAPRGGVIRGTAGVTYVEAPDPMGFALGGLALGTAAVMIVGVLALTAALFGVHIDWMDKLADRGFAIAAAIMAALPIIFFLFFFLAGKGTAKR